MYPKYPVHAKSIQVLGILVQSIFAFDLTLLKGNTISSPGGSIVSWGNFGHLRALFLFWPSSSFGMGFSCPRS